MRDCIVRPEEKISVLFRDEVEDEEMQAFTQTLTSKNRQYYCEVRVEGRTAMGMRDTGATQTQVRKDLVPECCYTGRSKTVRYANNQKAILPTAIVRMETPYYSGDVEVLVAKDAPVPVLIGNEENQTKKETPEKRTPELEGIDKELPKQKERSEQSPDGKDKVEVPKDNREKPVMTQNEPKMSIETQTEDPQTVMPVITQDDGQKPSTSGVQADSTGKPTRTPLKFKQALLTSVTRKELVKEQREDKSLDLIRKNALGNNKITERKNGVKTEYYLKQGVLQRKYQDRIHTFNQVVVPKKYRRMILQLAHDLPMAGHLGVARTRDRITTSFYWPGIDMDVRRYCMSCDACQRTMSRGKLRKAPLQELPVVTEPFSQVAVDIIGPITPTSSSGNRYVLTLIDYATRYAEAAAIPRWDTTTVAEALYEMWSRLGIPDTVISDRGTQFTSDLMQEIFRLLGIKGVTTTPYHAQANGLVERFNGTLKAMIQKLCIEQPEEWDRLLPAMLFAYREVPQESTHFSPFELLYGRTVKGPMGVLKKLWMEEEASTETRTTAEYITDLRNRIEQTCQIAAENMRMARAKYTRDFNKKAKERQLSVGDKVLVLLPDKHKRLQLSWKGPFVVTKKVNPVDYKVRIKGKEKTYHLNLMKLYHERAEQEAQVSVIVHEELHEEDSKHQAVYYERDVPSMPLKQTEDYRNIKVADSLNGDQKRELDKLVGKSKKVFSDLPGSTELEECCFKLTTKEPVRVSQYPLPHSQQKTVIEEVATMEKMGVIKKVSSPYNAPVVLVKKKDGAVRFCTDYRRLNLVTEFDAEPMPDIEGIFAKLGKAKYYSKLDLCKGFWQIPVKPEDQPKTAFSTPSGQYCWTRMPFGLKNASAVFSRMMRKLLGPLKSDEVHNFIDDVLIGSETWTGHLKSIDDVLGALAKEGLTAKPSKCCFGFRELSFLGHEIGHGIIKPESDKIERLQQAERPKTKKQVRAFLGLAGYYRKFIPNFSEIATPLTNATKKGNPDNVCWTDECEDAFCQLKTKLTSKPVLAIADPGQQFVLRTDASEKGLGAVLLQDRKGQLMPVAYASKKLLNAERNYSTIEKECLGIVWAIRKYEPFLYGNHFVLETDHRPLEYLRRSKTDNGRLMRWALQLQQHSFSLRVIPGEENIGADYMSRLY